MITQPTNVQCANIVDGVRITWDEGANPGQWYEIWASIDDAAYYKVTTLRKGIKTFDDTQALGHTLKYKILAIMPQTYSNPIRSKFDYNNYSVELFTDASGAAIHLEFQRGNMMFASKSGKLMWSTDMGYTFSEFDFAYANLIVFSHIFENGNVLFATENNKVYQGKNGLSTITEKTVKNADGSDFVFHTPVNPSYPGIYFLELIHDQPAYLDGNEMCVWGSYIGYAGIYQTKGAAPINVYYSADQGESVKVAYKHGYNASRDNGTGDGSTSTGTQLGDSTNTRTGSYHCHQVIYDKYDKCWYATFGEENGSWWVKLIYNASLDTWTASTAVDASLGRWYKACGLYITNTHFIISSDRTPTYGGVYKCTKANLTNYASHEVVKASTINYAPAIVWGDTIFLGHLNNELGCTISFDGGVTWSSYNSFPPILSSKRFMKMGYPNSKGEFLVNPYNFQVASCMGQLSYLIKFK